MAMVTTNFSSQSNLESLLSATQDYRSSAAYTALESTMGDWTSRFFNFTPNSYTSTSTSATIYFGGGLVAHIYGTNFGTTIAVVTRADITDGTSTLAFTGSVNVGGQYPTGVFRSISFNGLGYSEYAVGRIPLDGSPAVLTSWLETIPTALGNVSSASTGTLTISGDIITATYTSFTMSDDAGHTIKLTGLNYTISGSASSPPDLLEVLRGMLSGNDTVSGSAMGEYLFGYAGDDTLSAKEGNDTLNGGDGKDWLIGDAGNDTLYGDAGNDGLIGGAGNDSIDGGVGIDIAVFNGNRSSYTVTRTGTGFTTSGPDGLDTLTNVERLQFFDKKFAFDLSPGQAAGNAVRIIGAAFGAPSINPAFVGIEIGLFDSDMTMLDVCQAFVSASAFITKAGSSSNINFVNFVYKNVVGVLPSTEERNYFEGLLQGSGGAMTQAELLMLAANADANAVNINLVGLQQRGVEFV